MSSHRPCIVQCTEWHSPSTFSFGATCVQVGDVHGHRVGVVQQPRVRADLRHVRGDAGEHGEGPQAPEDAADADGVGDGLVQPVAGRDVEVAHGGVVHPHLDHVDDVVGAVERRAAVDGP